MRITSEELLGTKIVRYGMWKIILLLSVFLPLAACLLPGVNSLTIKLFMLLLKYYVRC